MKILIVSVDFPPKKSIASLRPYSFAKYWSALGHDITVLTTNKYDFDSKMDLDCSKFKVIEAHLPFWHKWAISKFRSKGANSSYASNHNESIFKKIKSQVLKFRNCRGILMDQRMPSLLDSWIHSAFNAVKFTEWDLVVTTYAPYATHLVGYKLRNKCITKIWIADYRDLWTQNHLYKGISPFNKMEMFLESKINKTADFVTTVSVPLAHTLIKNVDHNKVFVIENGFDVDDLKNLPKENFFNKSKTVICYTGTVYPQVQNPIPFFEAILQIKNSENSSFLENLEIALAGSCCSFLMKVAEDYGLSEYFVPYGNLDRENALRMQRDAHLLLFLGSELSGKKGILTGKLFEYLFSGTEILCIGETKTGDAGEIIADACVGRVLGNEVSSIKSTIIRILSNGKTLLSPNHIVLSKYTREYLANKMLGIATKNLNSIDLGR